MADNHMIASGFNGTIQVEGSMVVIRHKKVYGLGGMSVGEKRIPLASVLSVRFKGATPMWNGFLQIGVLGGGVVGGGNVFSAANDENSVMFRRGDQPSFERMRDFLEKRVAENASNAGSGPVAPAPDLAEQIRSLAELRDQGILSDAEFQSKKAQLLERM